MFSFLFFLIKKMKKNGGDIIKIQRQKSPGNFIKIIKGKFEKIKYFAGLLEKKYYRFFCDKNANPRKTYADMS